MENTFAVLWLQIITTQWTNICLVNISSVNYFLMIGMLFEFHRMLFFMSKSHSRMYYSSNVRKAARRSGLQGVCGEYRLTTTSWVHPGCRPFLHVIPFSISAHICAVILCFPLFSQGKNNRKEDFFALNSHCCDRNTHTVRHWPAT